MVILPQNTGFWHKRQIREIKEYMPKPKPPENKWVSVKSAVEIEALLSSGLYAIDTRNDRDLTLFHVLLLGRDEWLGKIAEWRLMVEKLVVTGCDIHSICSPESFQFLPITFAAHTADLWLVKLLVKNGVNVNSIDDNKTAIHWSNC